MGGDIRYELVGDSVYDFYFTFYRDCRGVKFDNPESVTHIKCKNGSKSVAVSLTLVGIKNISNYCSSGSVPCSPANTNMSGSGEEQHTYKTTVDFRTTKYKSLLGCGTLVAESGQCCRNSSISTGPANTNTYLYLEFDPNQFPKNSSPVFLSSPRQKLCCNTPNFLSIGAYDPDGDSLSYELATPLQGAGSNVTFSTGYSYANPVKIYDPTGKGVINPKADPPIGFYLNAQTGDLIFTPTKCDDYSLLNVQVKEWRKNSSGLYVNISTAIREVQLEMMVCDQNNAPTMSGFEFYQVCEGDSLSFFITSDDKVKVLPPPNPTPDPDTVSIRVLNSINGSTTRWEDSTARLRKLVFGWRPAEGDASDQLYHLLLEANDNHCPVPGFAYKHVMIKVNPRSFPEIGIDTLGCEKFALKVDFRNPSAKTSFGWYVFDTLGAVITNSGNHTFSSSGDVFGEGISDTVEFKKSGDFKLFISTQGTCRDNVFRYMKVRLGSATPINWPDTTIFCDSLKGELNANNPDADILWNDGSTDSSHIVNAIGNYKVRVKTQYCGTFRDSTQVALQYTPVVNLGNDTLVKKPFSIQLNASNADAKYTWSDGSTSSTLTVTDFGTYWVKVSNGCGTYYDTIQISDALSSPVIDAPDYKIFPNPSQGRIFIEGISSNADNQIRIMDLAGREINHDSNPTSNGIMINVETASYGMYILEINDGKGGVFRTKIQIE